MGTEILKSFGTLQSELEQARSSLKGVDENIKKLIGRDPSEVVPRPVTKRSTTNHAGLATEDRRTQQRGWFQGNRRVYSTENDEPPAKKRSSVFNRLADRVPERPHNYEEELDAKPHRQNMISKIIVTPKEIPSRQDALDAQSKDEKSKARNRRMFGALLGTLQKFQQEETKLKSKEEKRAQVEKKIEETEIREKAEVKKERQELFFNRKKKQAEIKMIELKMTRMKEYAQWEELQKPRMNFILTKTSPQIHFLPRRLNDANKAALAESQKELVKLIDKKRQEVFSDLQEIEERMKRNFEPRKVKEEKGRGLGEPEEHELMEDGANVVDIMSESTNINAEETTNHEDVEDVQKDDDPKNNLSNSNNEEGSSSLENVENEDSIPGDENITNNETDSNKEFI